MIIVRSVRANIKVKAMPVPKGKKAKINIVMDSRLINIIFLLPNLSEAHPIAGAEATPRSVKSAT